MLAQGLDASGIGTVTLGLTAYGNCALRVRASGTVYVGDYVGDRHFV